ncbi:trypsin-like peptidase domain-containing protein [Candidatus Woesebacteria bacterium]|nr:trypsin-like peptidase domain-containing protein [Candidatus Woesebacteria bacterium]MCD8506705.1 trypsin-like peptidase domain-containing protein [Candidatus Woesebacteria bacterium]MCD8527611.1 trypsin-like peptidase domain-containing protein [Candidatus Woesebacteria bacterium]MCD8546418.1 trypsin-like peptidase domain-containing protein [Candidatus Woesebacteria bacterium]
MKVQGWSGFLLGLVVSGLVLFSAVGGALADRLFVIRPLDAVLPRGTALLDGTSEERPRIAVPSTVTDGENVIIQVAENAQPSVVTVAIKKNVQRPNSIQFGPFGLFQLEQPGESQLIQQDIGTGFIVDKSRGFVVTNRHVVSDTEAEYTLIDNEGNEYEVQRIYRDPINDLAILETTADLPALPLANSEEIKIGQTVIAIGTALGEFRQTVTTGIVSGLGRGIEASTGFSTERIDNLIQTDAAINPGNSGGPLLNSRGEVIGVNVAMAEAENIGFAIPINVIKESLDNFESTGEFNRALLGVRYKLIPQETALLNDVPEGAYITDVLPGTTADSAGLQTGDILITVDSQRIAEIQGGLAGIVNQKSIGDAISLRIWRDGEELTLTGTLTAASQ